MINYYEVLEIADDASQTRISEKGRFMLKINHPYVTGKNETGQQFRQVYEAVAVLADKNLRGEYNYTLADAIAQGNVPGASLPPGAVAERIKLAQTEAAQLEKDYMLFYQKFLEQAEKNEFTGSRSLNGDDYVLIKIGIMLLTAGAFMLVGKMAAGGGNKPILLTLMGVPAIIGGILLLRKAFKK